MYTLHTCVALLNLDNGKRFKCSILPKITA